MKKIIINEKQKKKLNLLLEDKEGKNLAKARHYLQSNGYSPEQAQQMVDSIRTDIPNSRLQQCKFILGVARLYVSGQLSDGQAIAELNKTLKYIASDAHVNEYDYNLNNESLQVLVNRFKGVAKDDLQQSIDKSNSRQLTVNQDYNIIPIDNAEEAAKYGKYTSWCVTHYAKMYNSYTNNGTGRFYFCLKKGFENEQKVQSEGSPLDSYGLSMVAVSVDMEGAVNTITCRWNHDMGGNDNIMTVEQLEDLLGRNFYQTFKPYSREELHAKGVILFDEVQGLLDSGKKPEEIFDVVDSFCKGFAAVKLNGKWNFLNKEGKLLSNQWFDVVDDFSEGFADVRLNNKWNLINIEGQLLSNQWFDTVGDFREGFAVVYLNDKWNYINKEGQFLSNQWFDDAEDFRDGFARILLNHKYNFINIEGQFLSSQWFDDAYGFMDGFAIVCLNKKWYNINQKGEIVESKNRNKKTIIITEEHKKKIKDVVKVHHDVMLGVAAGDMAGMCEEEEIKGQYKLAPEPNDITPYYHVVDEAKNYDMNEIGGVNCQLNFDEDEYEEWLNDNELQNIPEVKNQFIKDYCTYSIEYLTPETFHGFDYDDLSYDEIINKFGQNMGMAMINDCMDGREHSFETLEYVEDTPVDLSNPNEVNAAAKKYMRTVDNPGGVRGFILTDGTVVDAGWDHIACTRIPGVESREHFVKLGNIRFSDTGLEFSKYPTNEQLRTLRMYCEYHQQDTIYVDVIGNKGRGDFTYNGLDYQDLINDLYNYFTYGIKNRRNDFYERKDMSSKKLIIETKTSVGNFDYTPYIKSILKFMDGRGYDIQPYPKIIIIDKEEDKDTVLITTGNYSPSDMVVRLYVKDRHPKDVLRSFAHEMIHHMQNIRGGKDMDWGTGGNLDDDDILERIEGEAYLQGNLIFRKWTEWLRSKKQTSKALNENVELDELSTDEVDLSSFEIKDQLNPYFWKDGHLDSRIRIKLLDIADDFIDTLGIDYDEAEDVIMTGSLANYNWSEEYSDIDLHIVVDFGLLGGDPKLLKDYFDAKRKLWNELHKDLRIYGFQVELYVQDASEIHASSGVYSLNKDKWLVKPNRDNLSMDDVDSDFVKEVVSQITEQIDGLFDIFNNTNDGYKLRKVGELAKDLFNVIKQERRGSLQKGEKEMVDGNIIFKTLRRNGYMEKLINLINDVYDKSNSI